LGYTQAPSLASEEIESLLKEARIARFCSLNKDRTIHVTPVWFRYENGQIIMLTLVYSHNARNVSRNSKVTFLVDVVEPQVRGAIVYGRAALLYPAGDEEIMAFAVPVAEKYMTKERAEKLIKGWLKISKLAKLIVKPERTASFDYAKDEVWNEMWRTAGVRIVFSKDRDFALTRYYPTFSLYSFRSDSENLNAVCSL